MSRYVRWPPTHRDPQELQPEVCAICNLQVGGIHLTEIYEGKLEGHSVCDVRHGCREYYRKLSGHDFRKIYDPFPAYEEDDHQYPVGSGLDLLQQ